MSLACLLSLLTPPPAEPCLLNVWKGRREEETETRGRPLEGSSQSVDGLELVDDGMFPTNPQHLNKYLAQYDDLLTFRLVDGRRPGPPSPHPVIGDSLEVSRASRTFFCGGGALFRVNVSTGWLVDASRSGTDDVSPDLESGRVDTR